MLWLIIAFRNCGEVSWWVLLSPLLFNDVSIATELHEDMLQLNLVLWQLTVQGLKSLPLLWTIHAHPMHESVALLGRAHLYVVNRGGSVDQNRETGQVGVHSLSRSSFKGP